MGKIEIGDSIVVVKDHPDYNDMILSGMTGVVFDLDTSSCRRIGVRFDECVDGHDLGIGGNRCEPGYGWYLRENEIEICEERCDKYEFDESSFREMLE